jgi:RNA polymerase sigma factor (sigma-70 family)
MRAMGTPKARRQAAQDARPLRVGSRLPARLLRRASDERLVAYVRDGSEPAFEVLFDRHYRGLLGFCVHTLGSVEEAEDAVQHAFLATYQTIVSSERRIALRPLLYTVARNRCLAVLHARRERPGLPLEPATENLFAEVQRREDVRDMLSDLARLPEDQRAALLLAEAGAMPHAEIAAVLGCPRTKVKALVFQARSSLIAGRTARATPCREIREQIATLHGPALRRRTIRRHLPHCAGCRQFRDEVRRQRRTLALGLPVASSFAFKEAFLAALFGAGAAGTGSTAVGAGSAAALAAKALVVAVLLGAGAAGLAIRDDDPPAKRKAAAATERAGPALGFVADPPAQLDPVKAAPVADERSDHRPRARDGYGVQSPERAAAPPDRTTRRGSDAAPTEEVARPERGVGHERDDRPSEDEAPDSKTRPPRRQSQPVEPEGGSAPPRASAPESPEPIRETVDSDDESDSDDQDDDDHVGSGADEDDDGPDASTADDDDDGPDASMADEEDDA